MHEIEPMTIVDKTDWGEGPWSMEHDIARWIDKDTDYYCQIERSSEGHLRGYVRIDLHHPLYGTVLWNKDARSKAVHDLTVGKRNVITIDCSRDEPPSYWLGFACNGLGEYSPIDAVLGVPPIKGDKYITWKEVERDVLSLAQQLHQHETSI